MAFDVQCLLKLIENCQKKSQIEIRLPHSTAVEEFELVSSERKKN